MPEWPSYGNFGKVSQKPHFLKTCKGGTKGNVSKIAQKISYVWKAQKHSGENVIIQYLICTKIAQTGQDFWRKQGLQKCPNGQVIAIFERSAKTRIFWKSTKGAPRENFQKSPKHYPTFERPKGILAKMSLFFIYYKLKLQRLEKILAQTAAPKVPEWLSYGNLCKVFKNPHFLKKCKGGTEWNFSKIAYNIALVWKAQKHAGANVIIL